MPYFDTTGSTAGTGSQGARFILASGSQRRRDIMALAGLIFVVKDGSGSDAEVTSLIEPEPKALTLKNAETKLCAALAAIRNRLPWDMVVLAADTTVKVDDDALGKPADEEEAFSMLDRLRGAATRCYDHCLDDVFSSSSTRRDPLTHRRIPCGYA